MCCICSILGALLNRLQNETIREGEKDHCRNNQGETTKWFGHVVRRHLDGYVNTVFREDFTKKRQPGCPKKRWGNQLREHLQLPLQWSELPKTETDGRG